MREELKKIKGQRIKFSAIISKYGFKRAYRGPDLKTVLLIDVKDVVNNITVADHLWFTCGKSWEPFCEGDVIEFEARVGIYQKGYKGRREDVFNPVSYDYRLERPTKMKKV